MRVSFDIIAVLSSLLLLDHVATQVDAFCSVVSSISTTGKSSNIGNSISSLPTRIKSTNNDDNQSEHGSDDGYHNMAMNEIRKARLEKESSNKKHFASGEELRCLREDLESLRQNLEWARALNDEIRIESLEKAISKGESRDPLFMYSKAQNIIAGAEKLDDATDEEKEFLIEKWSNVASEARGFLPQLNMEGLWVGK